MAHQLPSQSSQQANPPKRSASYATFEPQHSRLPSSSSLQDTNLMRMMKRNWLRLHHFQSNGGIDNPSANKSDSLDGTDQVNNNTQNMYVNVIEIFADGKMLRLRLKVVELVSYFASPQDATSNFKRAVSCFRDLMIFLRHKKYASNHHHHHGDPAAGDGLMGDAAPGLPAILPRSGMGFYLIDLFQLKLICWEDRCLILDHDQSENYNSALVADLNRASSVSSAVLVEVFVRDLRNCLQSLDRRLQGSAPGLSWPRDVIRECARSCMNLQKTADEEGRQNQDVVPFEMVVLDNALQAVTSKFSRHLSLIKPILNVLLEETVSNPNDTMLRRLLAFKKSLMSFETSVVSVEKAINSLLSNDLDMADLYLSQDREISEHEEVELLLEGYRSDLQEMQLVTRSMRAQIDDTKEFINTHLNETRNRIIRMNLYMEMCMLGVTFGACVGSIFGMNLNSGIDQDPYAFFIVTFLLIVFSGLIIFFFMRRFSTITDSGRVRNYPVLKDFFKYVDTIELLRFNNEKRPLSKTEFSDLLARVISKEVTKEEIDLIYPLFDEGRDGVLDLDEIQNIMQVIISPK